MPKKVIDLTGKRFGKLVVTKYVGKSRWLCKCDCGNEKVVGGANLKKNTSSCGCIKTKNLVGQRFGRILVLEKTDIRNKWNRQLYRCVCDCGKELYYPCEILTSKKAKTKSCGCFNKEFLTALNKKYNKIEIDGDIAKIYFYNSDRYAIIDAEDVDKIKDYCWVDNPKKYYPFAFINGKHIDLHRLIMPNDNKNFVTDHINRQPLDNRKCNLRITTQMQNCWNRNLSIANKTGYKNITYVKSRDRYSVSVSRNYKRYYLGYYKDIEVAKQKLDEFLSKNNF